MPEFEKIKWIVVLILNLLKEGFEGTLLLDFQPGTVSKKYRTQKVGYADEIK